jgi:hypothetical protein
MSTNSSSADGSGTAQKHSAGAYDVRNVIGALIGFFGIVLVIMGAIHNSGPEIDKAGGINANLWTGIGMVVVAVVFFAWTRLRPIQVDPAALDDSDDRGPAGH